MRPVRCFEGRIVRSAKGSNLSRTAARTTDVASALLIAGLSGGIALAATAPQPTSLTLKAVKSVVAPRAKDTLTGTLSKGTTPLAGRSVKLEKRAYGTKAFTLVTTKTTNSKGQVVLTVVPGTRKGQKEQYELVFAATATLKVSQSSIITITVN